MLPTTPVTAQMFPADGALAPVTSPDPGSTVKCHPRPLKCSANGSRSVVAVLAPPNTQTLAALKTRTDVTVR